MQHLESDSLSFTATGEDRLVDVAGFLRQVFEAPVDAPSFQPAIMRWKCYAPHPLWSGSRSYVLECDDRIVACGCVSPVRFGREGQIGAAMVMDWASIRRGAGRLLREHCERLAGALVNFGGGELTRKLTPRLDGVERHGEVALYARALRASTHDKPSGLRGVAKVARRALWSAWPPLPATTWECIEVDHFDRVWMPPGDFLPIHRSPEWLNYFLRCPLPFHGLELTYRGVSRGHALIANLGPHARLVDFVVDSERKDEWVAGASAVLRWVKARGFAEIGVASSLALPRYAYTAVGMRMREIQPAYMTNPRAEIPAGTPVELNLLIGDRGYVPQGVMWC